MPNLMITADKVGLETGGGLVTSQEWQALQTLGPCEMWDRERLQGEFYLGGNVDPWGWDRSASVNTRRREYAVAHLYAGTFTTTVQELQAAGCKVTYTAAAHSIEASRQAHLDLGLPYDYPHLTDPTLLQRYLGGYLAADVLICPSQHSAEVMRGLGRMGRIEVIPHGCRLPEKVAPLPGRFVVGYLGSFGPDKGVRYLLESWKRLAYKDATLVLAGRDSTSPWAQHLVRTFGGGNIRLMGWVNKVSDFYNSISLYVQPSVSEGFGCEVLEAMAHGRAVLCSRSTGAADVLGADEYQTFPAGNAEELANVIDDAKTIYSLPDYGSHNREKAEAFTWDKIRARYVNVWRSLL